MKRKRRLSSMTFKQKIVNAVRKLLFRLKKRFCTKTLGGYSILLLAKNKK